MKYVPIDCNPWGKDYFVYAQEETDERIDVYIKARPHPCRCPACGVESNHRHSTYERILQDIPLHCKKTYVHANIYKYDCENPDCKVRVFAEVLPFAHGQQIRTDALNTLILGVSMFLSSECASQTLSHVGISVSGDTIKRLYDRIQFIDNPDIEAVGIDDVAIRKGMTYATAIYDMSDHHMIALLSGRDGTALQEWLMSHKKIKVVARDRSNAFGGAISKILPDCVQVADRFHLLKNLLDHLKGIFNAEMPSDVFLQDGEVLDEKPRKIPSEEIVDTSGLNYDNTAPIGKDGEEILFDSRIRGKKDDEYEKRMVKKKHNTSLSPKSEKGARRSES